MCCSLCEKRISPLKKSGLGRWGLVGRTTSRRTATIIVAMPSTIPISTAIECSDQVILRKIYCQPDRFPRPCNRRIPAPISGEIAFPPNIPKNRMATRRPSSCGVYHVDRVYIEPGMYPASARPNSIRVARKPPLFFNRTCKVAMRPKTNTCAGIHLLGPICNVLSNHNLKSLIVGIPSEEAYSTGSPAR